MLPASAVPVISGVVSLVIAGDSDVGALGAVVSVSAIVNPNGPDEVLEGERKARYIMLHWYGFVQNL